MVLETHMKLNPYEVAHDRARFSRFLLPQNCENGPKMAQKQGFLNLLKNVVIKVY